MADDRLEVAIDTVTRGLLARAAEDAAENDWDVVPDVGEHDWRDIRARLVALAPWPPLTEYAAALEYLEGRSEK